MKEKELQELVHVLQESFVSRIQYELRSTLSIVDCSTDISKEIWEEVYGKIEIALDAARAYSHLLDDRDFYYESLDSAEQRMLQRIHQTEGILNSLEKGATNAE
jgi:hypothetical protein